MTTGKWAQPGVPHRGWTCIGMEDLEEPAMTCEMCEVMTIRYVHTMQHPDYPDELEVGCICAGHMEEDLVGARRREKEWSRKSRWLRRRWRREIRYSDAAPTGLEYLNVDGYHVSVYPRFRDPNVWGFTITQRDSGDKLTARKDYPSLEAAKLRAFDAMLYLRDRRKPP